MSAPSAPVVRPLTPADVPAADAAAWAALTPMIPAEYVQAEAAERERRGQARVAHLLETDPGGCWVAEADGEVVGCALALVRDGLWILSLFGIAPSHQGQGLGARLLAPALGYADGARAGIIASSVDPRAMRRYHRAGFDALPCLAAAGSLNASRIPDGLRSRTGDPAADRPLLDRVSRAVRGFAHGPDVEAAIDGGFELLVLEDRGWALERDGSPALVAALDDEAAVDLLWSCFARAAPGAPVHVDFIGAGNDWALRASLDAGLALTPEGPLFVRGPVGPLRPYIPSGAFL